MKVAIVGSGFAGLCMAIKLKEAGIDDFTIYEKAGQLGGTWRDNAYPGCACDVQSHLYSFSFDLNPNWTRVFSGQKEIWEYMERCADKFDVRKHIRFNTNIEAAVFDKDKGRWNIQASGGETVTSQFLVTATGGLSIPAFPDIPGKENFKGKAFHSAEWKNDYSVKGKNVAMIGTGASAIQIVPNIVNDVSHLDLFQRTPPWVLPKPDRAFTKFERWCFRNIPGMMRLYRWFLYWTHEFFAMGFVVDPRIMKVPRWIGKKFIRKTIDDPALQEKLIPKYTVGCKRVLLSNDYYPALNRENVNVITTGINRIVEDGVMTKDGQHHPADTIVYATGFLATEYLSNVRIIGTGEKTLRETWEEGGEAYLGTTVSGFPNLFMFTGPNTGLGHSSLILMMESQVAYIMDCIKKMERQKLQYVDVKKEAQTDFNRKLQDKIARSVWQAGGCVSWYQDAETGKNVTLWPSFTFTYRRMTRKFDEQNYVLV